MADDGLLLNLAPSPVIVARPAIASTKDIKGKWSHRLKVRRSLQYAQKMLTKGERNRPSAKASGNNDIVVETRKRSSGFGSGAGERGSRFEEHSKHQQIVSSLFTSNPDSVSSNKEKNNAVAEKSDPSNAPVKGDLNSFQGLLLHPNLARYIEEILEFKHPTAIQRAAIPVMLTSLRDLFIQAQTGSGKTLAYCLPIIHALMSSNTKLHRLSGLFGIIIAPTRELATQILAVLESLVKCCHYIVPGIVIGGEKKKSEKARLRKGVNILVCTPGRLADHLDNTEVLDLSELRWVVLDEGDRMSELGFEETITKILTKIKESSRLARTKISDLPQKRITVLCSATLHGEVEKLGSESLVDAIHVNADEEGDEGSGSNSLQLETNSAGDFSAPSQLRQEYIAVPMKLRMVTMMATLTNIIRARGSANVIIFVSCSDAVNFYYEMLTREVDAIAEDNSEEREEKTFGKSKVLSSLINSGFEPTIFKLHGSLSQPVRKSTLASFSQSTKGNSASILICTDVASRGLDLPLISHVIELDPPFSVEDHLHRVGRTARVGNVGWSTIFVLPGIEEQYISDILIPVHKKSLPIKNDFVSVLSEALGKKNWQESATNIQLEVERWILSSDSFLQLARSAFTSHVRAYTTHLSSERKYFTVRELHLGHLAKSFGLRETPADVQRARNSSSSTLSSGTSKRKRDPEKQGPDYAKKRLLTVAQTHANIGADEFNLG
ncbi:P-loop containing nucleoside triphosphate hydrolase protein [Lipomyces oligophaga]|uniref:P-loop containing nucleoside triphosphate hydrolase protein n=1 Tax=Lipomyces oligophaga TaxID=45792 RepID=UPI0034CEC2EA